MCQGGMGGWRDSSPHPRDLPVSAAKGQIGATSPWSLDHCLEGQWDQALWGTPAVGDAVGSLRHMTREVHPYFCGTRSLDVLSEHRRPLCVGLAWQIPS